MCSRMARGSVSAARMAISHVPRFSALVTASSQLFLFFFLLLCSCTVHTLVSALLRLTEVRRRLKEIENLLRKSGVGQRPGCKEKGQYSVRSGAKDVVIAYLRFLPPLYRVSWLALTVHGREVEKEFVVVLVK